MTEEEFINKIIQLYKKARDISCKKLNHNIIRGTSHSVSSETEDLFALFMAEQLNNSKLQYWVNKNITCGFEGIKSIQPDLFIFQEGSNFITHYFDVKMDLGWNRDIRKYLNDKNELIKKLRGKEGKYWNWTAKFFDKLIYQIVVLSGKNIGDKMKANIEYAKSLENIKFYVLTNGVHLNMYDYDKERPKLTIDKNEFGKLIEETKSQLL